MSEISARGVRVTKGKSGGVTPNKRLQQAAELRSDNRACF